MNTLSPKLFAYLIANFLALTLIIISFSTYTFAATANEELDDACTGAARNSAICQQRNTNNDPVKNILVDVIDLLFYAVGVLAVVMVVYGGFKYVKSDGDSSKVSEAKNTIIYALAGIVVALLANRLIVFLLNRLL